MMMKEQAYRAHAFLRERGATSLKRSHVHEVLASALGYSSYAAFQHDATWCDLPFNLANVEPAAFDIEVRCRELGLPSEECRTVSQALPQFLRAEGYAPVRFEQLIMAVEEDQDDPDWREWVAEYLANGGDRVLHEGLEAAALRGVASAHLAIAKLLGSGELWGDDQERERRAARRAGWSTPFVSYAEVEANGLLDYQKARHHLFAAARLGDLRAQLASAELYGDPAVLALPPSDDMDPGFMVDLAREHGEWEKAGYWLRVASREGELWAMRELLEDEDEALEQQWVWMHLSRLMGHDFSQDHHHAINEDGTPYDDDVGGPAYVGGEDAIQLDPLPADADAIARRVASELFAEIQKRVYHPDDTSMP